MLVLVLEASTTSAKAMLYDSEKGIVDICTNAYPDSINDSFTQDAHAVYEEVLKAGKQVAYKKDIAAIAVCGTWHSLVVCDKNITPVTRNLSWTYLGGVETAKRVRQDNRLTLDIYHKTGCMVHATYPSMKLLHLKEDGMDFSDKYILGQSTYIFYKMTGERLLSQSMASGTGLLNTYKLDLDDDILKMLGLNKSQFGDICTHEDTRPLSEDIANYLGVSKGIPVVPAHPDGALNQVGAGALEEGVMTFSVGTSGALRFTSSKPFVPEEPSSWCYVAPTKWICGAATNGACNCVDWYKKRLLGNVYSYKDLEDANTDIKNTPIFLPFLFGERSPGWNDAKKGAFLDLVPSNTANELFFGVMEGVLFCLYHCYEDLVSMVGEPKLIKVSGGVLKSKVWTDMLVGIFGKEVNTADMEQASVMGGVALALHAGGALPDLTKFNVDKGTVVTPNPELVKHYKEKYQQYKYWYDRTK